MGIQMTTQKSPGIFVLGRWDWDPICLKFECFFPNVGRLTCQFFFCEIRKGIEKVLSQVRCDLKGISSVCVCGFKGPICVFYVFYFFGWRKTCQTMSVYGRPAVQEKTRSELPGWILLVGATPTWKSFLFHCQNPGIGLFKTIFLLFYMVNHR